MLQLPSYLKFVIILLGTIMVFFVMIIGRAFIIPVLTAFIFALILHPVCVFLERWKAPRGLSAILSIILIFLVLFFTFYFISIQVGSITRDLTAIGSKFQGFIDEANVWLTENLDIVEGQEFAYFKDSIADFVQNSSSILTNTLSATADFFTSVVLIFISLFFLLYYRSFFVEFLYRLVPSKEHTKLGMIIQNGTMVVRSYVIGLFIVIMILAILNTTGLMLIGIEHAMFFWGVCCLADRHSLFWCIYWLHFTDPVRISDQRFFMVSSGRCYHVLGSPVFRRQFYYSQHCRK